MASQARAGSSGLHGPWRVYEFQELINKELNILWLLESQRYLNRSRMRTRGNEGLGMQSSSRGEIRWFLHAGCLAEATGRALGEGLPWKQGGTLTYDLGRCTCTPVWRAERMRMRFGVVLAPGLVCTWRGHQLLEPQCLPYKFKLPHPYCLDTHNGI